MKKQMRIMDNSIAVVIPTFNRKHCISRAIESVLSQTLAANEIIVVDDGSSDGTGSFLEEKYPQLRYLSQSNLGVSAARNRGVIESSSKWLAFLDSDDEWLEKKLELQIQRLIENPEYQLIHSEEIWIRNGVRVNQMKKHQKGGGHIFDKCLPLCAISPSSVILSRQLFEEVGGFDEELPACEDYDLWLKICSRYPVLFIEQALIKKYGGHDDQLSRLHWGMDRFRVQAMGNLLQSGNLNPDQITKTRTMLLSKCEILLAGAEKRDNRETVDHYRSMIKKYGE
jgi:glycosyltransferase involved in cell wall biosynthesis